MKCYVINLPRSIERRARIEKSLTALHLEYEIVEATDGRQLTPEEEQQCSLSERTELSLAGGTKVAVLEKLIPSEVGCAFSHLHAYQRILDSGEEYGCIMEDDCSLYPPFLEAIDGIKTLEPSKWDIINFSDHFGIKNIPWAKKYPFGSKPGQYFMRQGMQSAFLDSRINARRLIGMAALYVVNRKACQRLLEIGYPVRLPADYTTGMLGFNNLKFFRVYPAVDYYAEYHSQESSMAGRPQHKIERI